MGLFFSLLAGLFISLQNVFNARVSERLGALETTVVVHVTGLVVALVANIIFRTHGWGHIGEINRIYLLGGAFGVGIVYSIARGISLLGVSYSISVLLVSQLVIAMIIDTFGLFGSAQVKMDITKPVGLAVMVAGIFIYKLKG